MCVQTKLSYGQCGHEIEFHISRCNDGFRSGNYCEKLDEGGWVVDVIHDHPCLDCNPNQAEVKADEDRMKNHEADHIKEQGARDKARTAALAKMRKENENNYRGHMDRLRELNPEAPSVAVQMPNRTGSQSGSVGAAKSGFKSVSGTPSRSRGGNAPSTVTPLSAIAEAQSGSVSRGRTLTRDSGSDRRSQQREPGSRAHLTFPPDAGNDDEDPGMEDHDAYEELPSRQLMPSSPQTVFAPPPPELIAQAKAEADARSGSRSASHNNNESMSGARNPPAMNNMPDVARQGQEVWQDHTTADLRPVHWDENEADIERAMALSREMHAHQPMALADDDQEFQDLLEFTRDQYESGAGAQLSAKEQQQMQETMEMSKQMHQMHLMDQWAKDAAARRGGQGSSGSRASASASGSTSASRQAPLEPDNWTQRPAGHSGSGSVSRSGPPPARSSTANKPSPLPNSSSSSSSSASRSAIGVPLPSSDGRTKDATMPSGSPAGIPLPPSNGATQQASMSQSHGGSGSTARSGMATGNAPLGIRTNKSQSGSSTISTSGAANAPEQGRADPDYLRNQRLSNLGGSRSVSAAIPNWGNGNDGESKSSGSGLDKGKGRAP